MPHNYGKTIHIIGFAGTEGAALLTYMRKKFPRAEITAHNFCEESKFRHDFRNAHIVLGKAAALEQGREILELEKVKYCFQPEYLDGIEEADTIFVPQSWYLYPENKKLEKFTDKFRSITRLYFDLFPGKIIGVTGSNGKTTTANLIAEIMQRAYPRTLYTGNDRRAGQVLAQIELMNSEARGVEGTDSGGVSSPFGDGQGEARGARNDWLVMEISNRQLKLDLGKSPDISVITNITPNHLTEHKDFADYAATKASILKYQTEDQWSVLNNDDPESRKLIEIDDGETMPFSTKEALPRGVFVRAGSIFIKHAEGEEEVMLVADFPLRGEHNLSNALAAVAACHLADVNIELIAQVLRGVEPIPQRLELIDTIDGVEYFNDSASTVPESTIAAIETLKTPNNKVVLIMGGRSKGSNYSELAKLIEDGIVEEVFLKSPMADEIKASINSGVVEFETLKKAVDFAQQKTKTGDCVLFSPAAEYFVYFKNKMPDHKHFRHLVHVLKARS